MSEAANIFPRSIVVSNDIDMGHNGHIENYGDYARSSRRQINHLTTNGTDITAMLHSHVAGVVGSSVNIQSTLKDKAINDEFEDLIQEHGEMFNFDITGRFDRNEGLRLIEWFKMMNGGVLVRYHYNALWKIPMRVELIGVDRIDTSKRLENTTNGLQKNKYGRVTHVWLYDDDKNRTSKKYSMKNIIYYSPVWVNLSQYTSVSRLVTILGTLAKNNKYMDEELKAAIERAKAGVYWSTELYSPIMDAFTAMMKSKSTSKEVIDEAKDIMATLSKRGVNSYGATPIPQEDKIHKVENNTASDVNTFTQQSQKAMASSVGGSAVSTYKDIGIGNYASIKAAIAHDEEAYKIDFSRLVATFVDNYLSRLFMVGVQIGRISVPREEYFSNRRKFHSWDVLRVSKRSVDEKVAAVARAKDLESGSTTLVKEYGEKGLNFIDEASKQIDAEVEIAKIRAEKFKQAGVQDPLLQGAING